LGIRRSPQAQRAAVRRKCQLTNCYILYLYHDTVTDLIFPQRFPWGKLGGYKVVFRYPQALHHHQSFIFLL
jgi:hypothetical protein